MRKFIVGILVLVIITGCSGCAGLNVGTATNVATDLAFVAALQNYPSYKPAVVAGLTTVKVALSKDLTYDELIIVISKAFGEKYAIYGIILTGYIEADKPISETYLTMFDAYKQGVLKKVDRLLMLAGAIT